MDPEISTASHAPLQNSWTHEDFVFARMATLKILLEIVFVYPRDSCSMPYALITLSNARSMKFNKWWMGQEDVLAKVGFSESSISV